MSRYRALLGFAFVFAAIGLWSLVTPRYAAPDEPAHATKAAAVARDEWIGQREFTPTVPYVRVNAAGTIANGANPACLAFDPDVSAACLKPWTYQPKPVSATTYVGTYPPLYYFLVGLPLRFTASTNVLFYMRLTGALVSALFLTAAFVSASRAPRARWTTLGVAVAATPTAIYMAAVINPSGLEISAAICLWTSALSLFARHADGDARYRRSLVVWTAISAATLVQIRGLSPLLLLIVTLGVLAAVGHRQLLQLARRRDVQIGVGVVAACSIFAVAWILGEGSLHVAVGTPVPSSVGTLETLKKALHVGLDFEEIVAVFGWLTVFLPLWCYAIWGLAVVAPWAAGALRRAWRPILTAAGVAVVTVALPTLLTFSQAHRYGIVGQGRYILPVAAGVPVLSAYALSRAAEPARWLRPAAVGLGLLIGLVQVAAFVQALHRYRTGLGAPIWVAHAPWEPPLRWWAAIAGFALLQAGLLWWWSTLRPSAAGPAPAPGRHRGSADAQSIATPLQGEA
jgi:Predicted membrane protein (DUF2142)